jgi:hypothetical protein
VGDVGRLEQRLVFDDQRLDRQRRRAPHHVGDGDEPSRRRNSGRHGDGERQRREQPRRWRQHDHERPRLPRRHLREPGDALLHHVPLQPVRPRDVRREQPSLQRDATAGSDRVVAELGADAVVVRHGPRSPHELARNRPQPVIRHVNRRRIPRTPTGVAHRERDRYLIGARQDARRGDGHLEGEVVWRPRGVCAGCRSARDKDTEGNRVRREAAARLKPSRCAQHRVRSLDRSQQADRNARKRADTSTDVTVGRRRPCLCCPSPLLAFVALSAALCCRSLRPSVALCALERERARESARALLIVVVGVDCVGERRDEDAAPRRRHRRVRAADRPPEDLVQQRFGRTVLDREIHLQRLRRAEG